MPRTLLAVLLLIGAAVLYHREGARQGDLNRRLTAELTVAIKEAVDGRKETAVAREETAAVRKQLEFAKQESARLHEKVRASEAERAVAKNGERRKEIEAAVTELRGLAFDSPVEYQIMQRAEFRAYLEKKIDEHVPEAEFESQGLAFQRLGLLPKGFELRKMYLDLLQEQVAAFYDQHTNKLVMFADASLENSQNRVILAHELTHALQDQHFNLNRLPLEAKNDDDRALAASALVEGEATLVMTEYQLKNMSWRAVRDLVGQVFTQNMAQFAKAPRFLQETLMFPYLRGQEFCVTLVGVGGYQRVSDAYDALPSSTSQILHPRRYLENPRAQPVEVTWARKEFKGEKPAVDNVVGEAVMRVQLEAGTDGWTAKQAADGWRGDRYLYFQKLDALVWQTVWLDPSEAAQFDTAERAGLTKRYALENPREKPGRFQADGSRAVRLVMSGEKVLLIDAPTPELAEQLLGQFGMKE